MAKPIIVYTAYLEHSPSDYPYQGPDVRFSLDPEALDSLPAGEGDTDIESKVLYTRQHWNRPYPSCRCAEVSDGGIYLNEAFSGFTFAGNLAPTDDEEAFNWLVS